MKKSAFMDKFGKFFRTYSIVAVLVLCQVRNYKIMG